MVWTAAAVMAGRIVRAHGHVCDNVALAWRGCARKAALARLSTKRLLSLRSAFHLSSPRPACLGLAEARVLLGLWWVRPAGPRRAAGRDGATLGQAL